MKQAYMIYMSRWPLVTQMVSAGVIGSAGDAISQVVLEKVTLQEYDVKRTLRFFALPAFYIAPTLSTWFRVLERVRGSANLVPLKKLFIDQLIFAPVFSATIILNLRLLEGFSLKESWDKLVQDYWDIYKRSMQYWPCVQLLNFYLIPLDFRVVFVQVAALFWNVFFSHMTREKLPIPPLE